MKKIRLDFKYCERGRFYRTLLVKENINLVDLGCAILTAFNAAFEHNFYFHTKGFDYLPKAFMGDAIWDNELLMNDYTLEVLGDNFEFLYDTGDGWDFKAKVYKRVIEQPPLDDPNDDVLLLEGAGLGIFEDNIGTLYSYLAGEISPNSRKEDELHQLPWNLEMKKYGDFDEAFDIEEEKDRFLACYRIDREMYWEQENEAFGNSLEGDDPEGSNSRLHDTLVQVVYEQMSKLDYVKKTYDRLMKSYSEEETVDKIAAVLLTEIYNGEKESRKFDEKHYIEELAKLK